MVDQNPNPYTVGGTVQAGNGLYIERAADQELLALCKAGMFAYVLTARQMGKSSLMVHTLEVLRWQRISAATVDLNSIGADKSQISGDQWYLGILIEVADWLALSVDVVAWWQARTHLSFTQRMVEFFEKAVLAEVKTQVVIFIDEIDSTLDLPFTDDFFAAIRAMHNMRATQREFRRLGFVMFGVATPSDLIRDPQRTPFNIGQRVTLTDFTYDEARPLVAGLKLPAAQADQILGWVLRWTSGHPYLTQRLFSIIASQNRADWSAAAVDALVAETFFGPLSAQDNNLQFVRDMLTKRAVDHVGVLTTYRDVLDNKRPVLDEEQSLTKSHLKLSGAVRLIKNTNMTVSNLIYATVFNRRWVNSHLPRPYGRIALGTSFVIVVVLIGIVGLLATSNNTLNANTTATAAVQIAFQATSAQNATNAAVALASTVTMQAFAVKNATNTAAVAFALTGTMAAFTPTATLINTANPATIVAQLTQTQQAACPGGLSSMVTVSGFTQDSRTANPIVGATIKIIDTSASKQLGIAQTGTKGEFTFSLNGLCLGLDNQAHVVVTADITGYTSSSQTKTIVVQTSSSAQIQFNLIQINRTTSTPTSISTLSAENLANTADAQDTLTAVAGPSQTATLLTKTPTPTLTPTLNVPASAVALRTLRAIETQTQAVVNQTATATLWTAIPTFTPTFTPTLGTGSERTDSSGIKQVYVRTGCFEMGSDPSKDNSATKDEQPQHLVCINKPYWLDEFDVTNVAFDAFIIANGYNTNSLWSSDGLNWKQSNKATGPTTKDWVNTDCIKYSSAPNQPRVCVNYFESEAYARWRGCRLPTEAEWEYAARGPVGGIYPWGNTFAQNAANTTENAIGKTTAVDAYPTGKSWVGAYDMAGNVFQWVSDWYDANYYGSSTKNDPTGPTSGTFRVLRGGSWSFPANLARTAARKSDLDLTSRYGFVGFRVVCAVPGQ